MIIPRSLSAHLRELGKFFPILSLTGPRQAGKTTLLQHLFADYEYISFEDPEYRDRFLEDPRSFLARYHHQVIFDEAQRVPALFSYLQGMVDQDRTPGRFVLSGSQNFLLADAISQSLAGRVGIARLLPLDFAELRQAQLPLTTPWEAIYAGFYPIHFQMNMPPRFFYPNYVATYLERDIRDAIQAGNQSLFRQFLQLCATLVGQLINHASIAKHLGISVSTVKNWLSLLERSYVLFQLSPYTTNIGKRLIKRPKLYFYDVGLAAYLLEFQSASELRGSRYYGGLFENLIVANQMKQIYHAGQEPWLYFFRDSNGLETDLIAGTTNRQQLTEIKASTTYQANMAKSLHKVADLLGSEPADTSKQLVYGGQESFQVNDLEVIAWNQYPRI